VTRNSATRHVNRVW